MSIKQEREQSNPQGEQTPNAQENYRAIICIFTNHGKTYTFRNCSIKCSNESSLEFTYGAMSDGLLKKAKFPKANICGWSETR